MRAIQNGGEERRVREREEEREREERERSGKPKGGRVRERDRVRRRGKDMGRKGRRGSGGKYRDRAAKEEWWVRRHWKSRCCRC